MPKKSEANFLTRWRRSSVRLFRNWPGFKVASRHPFAVPVITLSVLVIASGMIYGAARLTHHLPPVHDAKIVIVHHDNMQQTVPTTEVTVGALLKKMGVTINAGDVVEPALTTPIDQDQFRVNIYRALPVKVIDGSTVSYTFSAATTPRAIATQVGENVYPEDGVTARPAQDYLNDGAIGQEVVINRAVPVNLNLYGAPLSLRTHAATVGELIKQKNITLAKDDELSPSADTPLTPNTQVFVTRHGIKVESVTETIAMPVQTIQDPSLAYGTSAIRQQGSAGEQVVTYQLQLSNGVVVGRTVMQKVVTKPAVTQIAVIGTSLSGIKGDMALAGISPSDYTYVDYIISHESGWCPTKAQGQYGSCPPYSGSVPSTGGYGLCQSTPGSKMASAGADWATNPITQLKWCTGYANRYGGWAGAYAFWIAHHWW